MTKINLMKADILIAILAVAGIALHLILRFIFSVPEFSQHIPLLAVLLFGGAPLVWQLFRKALKKEFNSDLLAALSITTSVILGEYLAGSLVVLMLSGGRVLEDYAVASASSVLKALAKRIPLTASRKVGNKIEEIPLDKIQVDDELLILPHQASPVDGVVLEGHGVMNEAYLTGEPFEISKAPGSHVLSGAVNGSSALTIRATKLPQDSRYAKIIQVVKNVEQNRPPLRRLGDQLGAYYTPLAVGVAVLAWLMSGSSLRFLSVLVVATPCPLLIAIPVAMIASVSLAAKRGIIIRDPAQFEQVSACKTIIFDKTGTLTYGEPQLTEELVQPAFEPRKMLQLLASLEQYSKHPLAIALLHAAKEREITLLSAVAVSEIPGRGMQGKIGEQEVLITHRKAFLQEQPQAEGLLPAQQSGLECVVLVDGVYAATYRFRDGPRSESKSFIQHLSGSHHFDKVMLVSGDRDTEVRYLAEQVGIQDVYASQSPEEKVNIVLAENKKAKTMFIGDGINDAPALLAATVGIAIGQNSEVTSEAAGAVIMDSSLVKVDEFFHISRRMRAIALQSAIGGMLLSVLAMFFAAQGFLNPVSGAVVQELIDVVAILNALRAAFPVRSLVDFAS